MAEATTNFAYQNWVIAPSGTVFNTPPPNNFRDQRWIMTLTGIIEPDFKSNTSGGQWNRQTFSFAPSVTGPIGRALHMTSTSVPPDLTFGFVVEDFAILASLNSIFDKNQSVNAGFAVDNCRPHFGIIEEAPNGRIVQNVLGPGPGTTSNGEFWVDLAVCDSDAIIYRVGYNITLYGRIAFGE
ncbi:hypothetical protein [uncultured Sphingomonas sp.]|uniref:hypothetical protein n=1 Tax=uncultured Sphingomonas sp. TaxID=158754 RepID=UPI0035CB3E81